MLSARLSSLLKYVSKDDKVIDIGCDHALLDIELVKTGVIENMIAADIHKHALEAGIVNVKKNKLIHHIDMRLGDGLNVLNEEDDIDTVLISGMGTSTIISILSHPYTKKINKLILQSNNNHSELRTEICKLGFKIDQEEFLTDNKKHYINIIFTRGKESYTKLDYRYGPILIHQSDYLDFEIQTCNKILGLLPKNKRIIRYRLTKEIKGLEKLIKDVENKKDFNI